jgi:hypothetical protein
MDYLFSLIFRIGAVLVNGSVLVLVVFFFCAAVDHFAFEENFRPVLIIVGKAALLAFCAGVVLVVSAGVHDKLR